jgi:HK97 family phage portal protein
MGFLDRFRFKSSEKRSVSDDYFGGIALNYSSYNGYQQNKALLLSAVYRCVECISDTVAQLPLKLYSVDSKGFKIEDTDSELYDLLTKQPNEKMTAFSMLKASVASVLLNGNAYILIRRENNKVKDLLYIPAGYVNIIEAPEKIEYQITGYKNLVPASDIIHLKNISLDGVRGVSTLQYARVTLGIATASENTANNFFKSGGAISGILSTSNALSSKQKEDVRQSWASAYGSNNDRNGIAVLDGNWNFQELSISPADAQLLESRKFNVIDIARFFGVPPTKLFDTAGVNYNSLEMSQLAFLTDCIQPLLYKIEQEFEVKLFNKGERTKYDVKFDTTSMLRVDKTTLANYYNTLFNMGVLSPNDIRKSLDLPAIEHGDMHIAQVNLTTLDNIAKMAEQPIDNKLKTGGNNDKEIE